MLEKYFFLILLLAQDCRGLKSNGYLAGSECVNFLSGVDAISYVNHLAGSNPCGWIWYCSAIPI